MSVADHVLPINRLGRGRYLRHLLLTLGGLLMIAPFVWMLLLSLQPAGAVVTLPLQFWPSDLRWENYRQVWEFVPFTRFYWNSTVVAVGVVISQVITSTLAGFAFARLRFPGRELLFYAYLATMMLPYHVTLVPSFFLLSAFGMLDTYSGLILPFAATPYGAFLMRQFFLQVPAGLVDAAKIDGCTVWQTLIYVLAPLVKPAIAVLSLLMFLFTWNDFLWPLIMTNTLEMRTVQVGLAMFKTELGGEWPILMAATVMATLPVLPLLGVAHRSMVPQYFGVAFKE